MRFYLDIPFIRLQEAKTFCAQSQYRIYFDGDLKKWYYFGKEVPPPLKERYPILFEKDSPPSFHAKVNGAPSTSGQQSAQAKPVFEYTPEQKNFINAEPGGTDNLLIARAFAGAAKTTSLKAYTKARPEKKFLYLAFNASVAKEAQESFSLNTDARTIHSLARKHLSKPLLNKVVNGIKADVVCSFLNMAATPPNLAASHQILHLLHNYFTSPDLVPSLNHILGENCYGISMDNAQRALIYANRLWEMMKDPNSKLGLTHDAYLKLYALTNPQWGDDGYDYALLDEGQDTDGATEGIFFGQRIAKIVVGDPHQGIYAFRQARDVLSPRLNDRCPCVYLTTSFRFGQNIADIANIILSNYKKEKHPVIGKGAPATVFQPLSPSWGLDVDGNFTPYTFIARSNSTLFENAVSAVNTIEAYEIVTGRKGPKIGWVGTSWASDKFSPLKPYKLRLLLDVAIQFKRSVPQNQSGRSVEPTKQPIAKEEPPKPKKEMPIDDPFIAQFSSFFALENYVQNHKNANLDLVSALKLVRRYKHSVIPMVYKICAYSTDPNHASVWTRFTTAHKSKGLEFDRVRLAKDFGKLLGKEPLSDEEINLIYVSVTRPKKELQLNLDLLNLLVGTKNTYLCSNYVTGIEDSIAEIYKDSTVVSVAEMVNRFRLQLNMPLLDRDACNNVIEEHRRAKAEARKATQAAHA